MKCCDKYEQNRLGVILFISVQIGSSFTRQKEIEKENHRQTDRKKKRRDRERERDRKQNIEVYYMLTL